MTYFSDTLESNLDFYCFVKRNLPAGYRIIAEPRKDYYSEWSYNYQVFKGEELVRAFSGDFRELSPDTLVLSAGDLLSGLGVENAHW
jgi:hypothetical protein